MSLQSEIGSLCRSLKQVYRFYFFIDNHYVKCAYFTALVIYKVINQVLSNKRRSPHLLKGFFGKSSWRQNNSNVTHTIYEKYVVVLDASNIGTTSLLRPKVNR